MILHKYIRFFSALFVISLTLLSLSPAFASTQKHSLQLGSGVGLFVGSEGFDASFDFDLEPEFFVTDHASLSFRFDLTVGGFDSAHLGSRFRYYFDIPNHERFSLYIGAGGGVIVNFHGSNFGDIAVPVFGFQYDLTDHIRLGSDVSFDIVFNGSNAAFATRLMPIQFKWAF